MIHRSLRVPVGLAFALLVGCAEKQNPQAHEQTTPSPVSSENLSQGAQAGFVVVDDAAVFSDPALTTPYGNLPLMTQVSVYGERGDYYEIRIALDKIEQTGYMRKEDLSLSSAGVALQEARRVACNGSIARPGNNAVLSGMLENGRILEGYESPTIEREDFQDLGLEFVEIHGRAYPEVSFRHRIRVAAPLDKDAFVRVKDTAGRLIAGFYVQSGQEGDIDLPSGKFNAYFTTGQKFSTSCNIFTEDASFSKDGAVLDFSEDEPAQEVVYSLTPKQVSPGSPPVFAPEDVSEDEFLK